MVSGLFWSGLVFFISRINGDWSWSQSCQIWTKNRSRLDFQALSVSVSVKLRDQTESVRSEVEQGVGFNLWVVPLS